MHVTSRDHVDTLQTGGQNRRNHGLHCRSRGDLAAGRSSLDVLGPSAAQALHVLLFVPFFYALATYFLVGLGCSVYNFAARMVGGFRIDVARHTQDTEVARDTVVESAEKPAAVRKVA